MFLPIEAESKSFFFEPFGPFHNRNIGTIRESLPGIFYYTPGGMVNQVSIPCEDNCLACDIKTRCLSCLDGFFFHQETRKCVKCSDECASCEDHPERCTRCKDSSILLDQGKLVLTSGNLAIQNCLNCHPLLCKTCKYGVCQECVPGTFFDGRTCVICGTDEYFDSERKICEKCPRNCLKCASTGACLKCDTSYALQVNENKCICLSTCPEGIQLVSDQVECRALSGNCFFSDNRGVCRQCKKGYFLKDHECFDCINNCLLCFDQETCLQCLEDHAFDFEANECVALSVLDKSTSTGDSLPLLFLDLTQTLPLSFYDESLIYRRRDPNCVSFDIKGICLRCRLMYYLGLDNNCYPCDDRCLLCESFSQCLRCREDYVEQVNPNLDGFVSCVEKEVSLATTLIP